MDVNQLRNFLQLAAKLNFRETSNDSYISQPALSRQIQNLEAEIGAMLFKRTTKQVELTVAGQYFQTEMTRLVSNLDTVIRRTAQIHRGEAGEIKRMHGSEFHGVRHSVARQSLYLCFIVKKFVGNNFKPSRHTQADF